MDTEEESRGRNHLSDSRKTKLFTKSHTEEGSSFWRIVLFLDLLEMDMPTDFAQQIFT